MKIQTSCLALAAAYFFAPRCADAGIVLTWLPATSFNANGATMDATLGISGYQIVTFEAASLPAGLSLTLTGAAGFPQSWTTLPSLFDVTLAPGGFPSANNQWDAVHTATNNDQIANPLDGHFATLSTFDYLPGTTSFGIGLSNFQSLDLRASIVSRWSAIRTRCAAPMIASEWRVI
jgi:hypothetical protein